MPRLATSLLKRAKSIHPFLPLLLRATRDLDLARNELRWLAEYQGQLKPAVDRKDAGPHRAKLLRPPTLRELCIERSHGRPLQYILGTQPFGDLEILCRKGVFIPRSTTEQYVERLAKILKAHPSKSKVPPLKILDPCTGTGCILLSLYAKLAGVYKIRATAVDISEQAIALAKSNLQHNIANGTLPKDAAERIQFVCGDFRDEEFRRRALVPNFDVVALNPPYMTERQLRNTAERSVRLFEPRRALVGVSFEFEKTAAEMLHPRGGVLLVEHVYEEAAFTQAYHLFKGLVRRSINAVWPMRGLGRNILSSIFLWRDHGLADALVDPSRRVVRLDSRAAQARLVLDCKGPVNALACASGIWYSRFLKGQGLDVEIEPEAVTNESSEALEINKRDAIASRTPAVAGAPKPPSLDQPENADKVIASLTDSVCEALYSVRTLSETVQRQRDMINTLLEEQASLWNAMKALSRRPKS